VRLRTHYKAGSPGEDVLMSAMTLDCGCWVEWDIATGEIESFVPCVTHNYINPKSMAELVAVTKARELRQAVQEAVEDAWNRDV
jgi:hypothetical protein